MDVVPSLDSRKKYQLPQMTVFRCEISNSLLIASNEGLGYEDLFTTNEAPLNDGPVILLP